MFKGTPAKCEVIFARALSGDNLESPSVSGPIYLEIVSVRSKNDVCPDILRKHNKGGVSKVHRQVLVFPQKLPGATQCGWSRGDQYGRSLKEELETDSPAIRYSSEKVGSFRKNRFRAQHRPVPALKKTGKGVMMRLAAVEQGDECPGVQQEFT